METKIKWNEGDGYITATYEGSGNGSASISSDVNEGIDRTQSVKVETTDKSVSAELMVSQVGLREVFEPSDGLFVLADGGTYNVLKIGGEQPDTPVETYTRLTYIECTAKQYFDSGYVVQETDTIEAYYEAEVASVDKFLYCSSSSQGGVWLSIYSTYAYVRFGNTSSKSINNGAINHYIKVKKNSVVLDVTTTSLSFEGMPSDTLTIFGGVSSSGLYNAFDGKCTMIKITDSEGLVKLELRPVKRDSDGKIGMLDIVSGKFFVNEGNGADFIGGAELRITDEYELIERVAFNNNIAFDTGYYGNEQTYIDVMFQRTDTSGADYMFGCSSGSRLTGYLTSSGYWRYGSAAPTFNTNSKKIYVAVVTPTKTTVDGTSSSKNVSEFTTARTIPLGGHKASQTSDTISRTYQGYVYYFRMKHGSEQLLDWFPCRRKSDGLEGFWDCVTQSFVEPI